MTATRELLSMADGAREEEILAVLHRHMGDLMVASPAAFEAKFRKMASTPYAFYRGSAYLFYHDHDLESVPDP